MSYQGSVILSAGIKTANNGTYPLADAKDVYVNDATRLDGALAEKADYYKDRLTDRFLLQPNDTAFVATQDTSQGCPIFKEQGAATGQEGVLKIISRDENGVSKLRWQYVSGGSAGKTYYSNQEAQSGTLPENIALTNDSSAVDIVVFYRPFNTSGAHVVYSEDIPSVSDKEKWDAAADREFLAISSDRSVALAKSAVETAFPYTTEHPASSASYAANGFSLNLKTYLDGFISDATITKVRLQSISIRLRVYSGGAKVNVVKTGTSSVLAQSNSTNIGNTGMNGKDVVFTFSDGVWLEADKWYDFTLVNSTSGEAIPTSSIRLGFSTSHVIEGFEVLSDGTRSAYAGSFGRGMTVDYLAYASIRLATYGDVEGKLGNSGEQTLNGSLTVGSRAAGSTVGTHSVAEGTFTTASGNGSHAEGIFSEASGDGSHAEGIFSEASGDGSHAEGSGTTASGTSSHAEGSNTKAQNDYEHAQGFYNDSHGIPDFEEGSEYAKGDCVRHGNSAYQCTTAHAASEWDADNWQQIDPGPLCTLFSIGFGVPNGSKNAIETMQDGKTYIYGLGGYDGTNPTAVGVKDLAAAVQDAKFYGLIGSWDGTTPPGGNTVSYYAVSSSTATLNVANPSTFTSGRVLAFIVNVQNLTSSQATINFGGLGSDWYAVVDDGEDLTDMTTLAGNEIARFCFTQMAFKKNDKPVMWIAKQVVTEVQSGGSTYQLETDGTVTTDGELNADGTFTVEGELNNDGTFTVEAI